MVPGVLFWVGFHAVIFSLLALDLGICDRDSHRVSAREAAFRSVGWVVVAMAFASGIWVFRGQSDALAFVAGYLLEKSLSVDNILLFVLIFRAFDVPSEFQSRVLKLGVVGALIMRGSLVVAGAALLHAFHWAVYAFSVVVVWSGIRLFLHRADTPDPARNTILRMVRRILPVTSGDTGGAFIVRRNGAWMITPLLLVLVLLELTDLLFALDSVPAVFAVTGDPALVYTSNVFAILGLRALYFVVGNLMEAFRHLKTGLAVVLILTGIEMAVSGSYPIPVGITLTLIVLVFGVSAIASRWPAPQRASGHGSQVPRSPGGPDGPGDPRSRPNRPESLTNPVMRRGRSRVGVPSNPKIRHRGELGLSDIRGARHPAAAERWTRTGNGR